MNKESKYVLRKRVTYFYDHEIVDEGEADKYGKRPITEVYNVPALGERFTIEYMHKPGDFLFGKELLQMRLKNLLQQRYVNNNSPLPEEVDKMKWIESNPGMTAHSITVEFAKEIKAPTIENPFER